LKQKSEEGVSIQFALLSGFWKCVLLRRYPEAEESRKKNERKSERSEALFFKESVFIAQFYSLVRLTNCKVHNGKPLDNPLFGTPPAFFSKPRYRLF